MPRDALKMQLFTGKYSAKIDSKGRLVLPSKWKVLLPDPEHTGLIIRQGFEPHLILYPLGEYEKLHEKMHALSEFDPKHRSLRRNFFRGVTQVTLDGLGRILVPRSFLGYAALGKEAVLVGVGESIEIWSPENDSKHVITDREEFSQLAKNVLDG